MKVIEWFVAAEVGFGLGVVCLPWDGPATPKPTQAAVVPASERWTLERELAAERGRHLDTLLEAARLRCDLDALRRQDTGVVVVPPPEQVGIGTTDVPDADRIPPTSVPRRP